MLTEAAIKAAKPSEKPYKLADAKGLYLLVKPNGSRLWRLKYRMAGVERLIALGAYGDVSLKRARDKRDEARKQLSDGIDPASAKKHRKSAEANTFAALAGEWLDLQRKKLSAKTLKKAEWTFNDLLNPYLGSRPIRAITAPDLLEVLRKMEARGKHETAHRMKQRAGQVFRYAIATGRAERDPTQDLRGALAPVVTRNHPAVTDPKGVAELLLAIDGYRGQPATEIALKLAPLLFVRPGELRGAKWEEFTLEGNEPEWRIPANRMKKREQHIVPLAPQVVALIEQLKPITGPTGYLFPALTNMNRPMSENTVTAALRRLGYSGEQMTWHGFRTIASTMLNELGWSPDLIELQLAHKERDKVRAAYNRAERLSDRRRMMTAWADYLEELKRKQVKRVAA